MGPSAKLWNDSGFGLGEQSETRQTSGQPGVVDSPTVLRGLPLLHDPREDLDDCGIRPATAGLLAEDPKRISRRKGRAVGACGRQRIENVHHLEDPGRERDGLLREAIRVPGAVPALVM